MHSHFAEEFSDDFQIAVAGVMCRNPFFAIGVGDHLDSHHFSQVSGGRYLGQLVDWAKGWHYQQGRDPKPVPWELAQQWGWDWCRQQRVGSPQDHWSNFHNLLYRAFSTTSMDSVTEDKVYRWVRKREQAGIVMAAKEVLDKGGDLADLDLANKIANIQMIGDADDGFLLSAAADIHNINLRLSAEKRQVFPMYEHPSFTKAMRGGPAKKEMVLFAGPTNVGKTTTVCSVASKWVSHGFNVAHFSLEQGGPDVMQKYVCGVSEMSGYQYETYVEHREQWVWYIANNCGSLYVREFPTGVATLADIRAALLKGERQLGKPFDIVVLDYPDLLKLPNPQDRRGSLIQLYTEFRGMAKMMDFLAVAPTQTNRGSVGKEAIHVDDLAEAFDKGAITDFMIGLGQTDQDYENKIVNWFLAKNRVGEKYLMNGVLMNFDSCQATERVKGEPQVVVPNMPYYQPTESMGSMVRVANPQVFGTFRPGPERVA